MSKDNSLDCVSKAIQVSDWLSNFPFGFSLERFQYDSDDGFDVGWRVVYRGVTLAEGLTPWEALHSSQMPSSVGSGWKCAKAFIDETGGRRRR